MVETSRGELRRSLVGEHQIRISVLLFALLGAPLAWSLHFLLIYFLVALFCTTGWTGVGIAVGVATLLFCGLSLAAGMVAYRQWRRLQGERGWEAALTQPRGWTPFLLLMGMLGAALFTFLIVIEGVPVLFVPACAPLVQAS